MISCDLCFYDESSIQLICRCRDWLLSSFLQVGHFFEDIGLVCCENFNLPIVVLLISVSCFTESSEAHSAEEKASSEKNRRRFKTPAQLAALESFYNGKLISSLVCILDAVLFHCL